MISECEAGFYVLSCVNIDNFKVINAQYGTQTGDNVICHVSATMAKHMAEIEYINKLHIDLQGS